VSQAGFSARAGRALRDAGLQSAMAGARGGFIDARARAIAGRPDFEALRDEARAVRNDSLARLPALLEQFERSARAHGAQVHWAQDAAQANRIIVEWRRAAGAGRVIKGKSMVGEEIGLNAALEGAGFEVVETDLGEYIVQLAGDPPSHIIAPAVHKSRADIAQLFDRAHGEVALGRGDPTAAALLGEARRVLREKFLNAQVGITGANILVAETGSVVLVTNEGNGDLTSLLPDTHIVVTGLEKVVATLADAGSVLRVLARSATGQVMTSYTSLFTGARRPDDPDGPGTMHIVLVDNGRSGILNGPYREMLRCIRCGACLNHCPVYGSVGGHAYGWVYPGPMGAVLTPLLSRRPETYELAHASTLCGRCEEVCPVRIPLPALLRGLRGEPDAGAVRPTGERPALRAYGFALRHPSLFRLVQHGAAVTLRLAKRARWIGRLPLLRAWTAARELPPPPR